MGTNRERIYGDTGCPGDTYLINMAKNVRKSVYGENSTSIGQATSWDEKIGWDKKQRDGEKAAQIQAREEKMKQAELDAIADAGCGGCSGCGCGG